MEDAEALAARRTVERMLGCPVAVIDDPAEFLADLQGKYCFAADLQPALTARYLGRFLSGIGNGEIHELHEPLGMVLTAFRLGDVPALIGPYTQHPLHPGEAETLLGGHGIPAVHVHAYKLYRARFAIVDSEYARRGAVAMLALGGIDADTVGFVRTQAETGPVRAGAGGMPHSASFEVIGERYAVENEFMHAVTEGDEQAALKALQKMAGIPQTPSYLHTPFLGATIIRIMARVAAQQGGLPPVSVDAISQSYAQRLHRSGHSSNVNASLNSITAMVSEFCRAMQRHRRRPFSRLVRQVMDEVDLHLSHSVSAREIAGRLHVSESHLARTFKAETGMTISQHVARERVSRAAHLLATTSQPVRDIAAYVGYPDANYFVKVFRAARGLTPTAYRKSRTSD